MIYPSITSLHACICLTLFLAISASNAPASSGQCDETTHVCLIAQSDMRQFESRQESLRQSMSAPDKADLSDAGEAEYVAKIKKWLASLPAAKREIAAPILANAHDEMHSLRKAIYLKKLELAAVRFDNQESLAELPKLGMDLQKLRATLRAKLEKINSRLMREAGIQMDELAGEGFWLQPLAKTPKRALTPMDDYGVPISMTKDYFLPLN